MLVAGRIVQSGTYAELMDCRRVPSRIWPCGRSPRVRRDLMMSSFEEYLRPITAYVPPALISPSAFSDINSVANVLPATLAHNTFFFECRLGERAPRADFVLARSSHGRSSLAGLHPTSTLPARLMADTVWRRGGLRRPLGRPSSLLPRRGQRLAGVRRRRSAPPTSPCRAYSSLHSRTARMDDIEVAGEPNAEGRLATVERTDTVARRRRTATTNARALLPSSLVGREGRSRRPHALQGRRRGPAVHPAPLRGAHHGVSGCGGLAWRRGRPSGVLEPLASSVDRAVPGHRRR